MKANAKIKLNCIILKMWRKGEKLHGKGTLWMDGWILGGGNCKFNEGRIP